MTKFNLQQLNKDSVSAAEYNHLLNQHLEYISKVCQKAAVGRHISEVPNVISGEGGYSYIVEQSTTLDGDCLFIQVLDHLKEDDFRRLREFKGRCSITTYLTSIISRFVVDIIRSRSGRSRAKERAVKLGILGEQVYDLMIQRGHSASETAEIMETTFGRQVSVREVQDIHAGLVGRDTRYQSCAESNIGWGDDGCLVAINAVTPEGELSDKSRQKWRSELLSLLLENLKGEDRLLLRLRFPLDEEAEPHDMATIAAMVGLSEQQAERKLRRILIGCREQLLKKGFSLNDLL